MSLASNVITLAVVVGVAAIGFTVLKAKLAGKDAAGAKFKPKPLMTPNELEFLARLEAAVPELRFCPQVAMGALLDPALPRSNNGKAHARLRNMFSQKVVDFVAQARTDGSIVAIIELDDRTHDVGKDSKRDAMLASAGYRVVRWTSRSKPDAAAIKAALSPETLQPAAVDLAAARRRRPGAPA